VLFRSDPCTQRRAATASTVYSDSLVERMKNVYGRTGEISQGHYVLLSAAFRCRTNAVSGGILIARVPPFDLLDYHHYHHGHEMEGLTHTITERYSRDHATWGGCTSFDSNLRELCSSPDRSERCKGVRSSFGETLSIHNRQADD